MPWQVCHGKHGVALGVDDLDGAVAHHHAAGVEVAWLGLGLGSGSGLGLG